MKNTKQYFSILDIKSDLNRRGLLMYNPSEIANDFNKIYHKVYRFSRKSGIKMSDIWEEVGIPIKRIQKQESFEKFLIWAIRNKVFNKKLSEISTTNKNRIRRYSHDNDITLDELYKNLNIDNRVTIYDSFEDMKVDIINKKLQDKSPQEIMNYDSGKTLERINKFCWKNQYSRQDVYRLLGIKYNETIIVSNGKPVRKPLFSSKEEALNFFEKNALVGKTKKQVHEFDFGKTADSVRTLAKKESIDLQELWSYLGILNSERATKKKCKFTSEIQVVTYLTKYNLNKLSVKELRVYHKGIYESILEFCKESKMPSRKFWNKIGIVAHSGIYFNSIDEVSLEIKKREYRTIRDIRNDTSLYDAIWRYTKSKGVKLSNLWKLLDIQADY